VWRASIGEEVSNSGVKTEEKSRTITGLREKKGNLPNVIREKWEPSRGKLAQKPGWRKEVYSLRSGRSEGEEAFL